MAKGDRSSQMIEVDPHQDMEVCAMQKAEHILSLLGTKSAQHPDFVFRRMYRYLYHPGFYQSFSKEKLKPEHQVQILSLIESLRSERYRPGNKNDPYLFHAMNQLLTAIYQPSAMTCVKTSAEEALRAIVSIDPAEGWVIQMPADRFFQQISPTVFEYIVGKKISDGRWFRLARRLLSVRGWPSTWLDILLQSFDRWMVQRARVRYVRYQTDIFLLIQDTRNQVEQIRREIDQWMIKHIGVNGFAEQSKVCFFARHRFSFLEHEIQVDAERRIRLLLPIHTVNQSLRPFRKQGKSVAVSARIYLPIERLIQIYRAERKAFSHRYPLAKNLNQRLRTFSYYHFLSLLKTIARKKNLSVKKVRQKYQYVLADYWS